MAVETDGALTVDVDGAARMLACATRTVRRMIKDHRLSAEEDGQHPNGRSRLLIPVAQVNALLAERQGRALPATCGTALVEVPAADLPAAPEPHQLELFAGVGRPAHLPITRDGLPDIAAMSACGLDSEAKAFSRRSAVLSELKDARTRAEYGEIGRRMDDLVKQKGISRRTAYRWAKKERDGGPSALVPDWQNGRGDTVLPDHLQREVLDYWLRHNRPSFEQTHAAVVVPEYAGDGRQCPTVGVVRRLIRARVTPLDEAVFRHGGNTYEKKMAPRVTCQRSAVGSRWTCDTRKLNVFVLDRSEPGKERAVRPEFVGIFDDGSAAINGWRLVLRSNGDAFGGALFSALLAWGSPDEIQTDNGREYTSKRFGGKRRRGKAASGMALPEGAEDPGIWAALGIRISRAIPYHPWAKPAESFFAALSRWEENLLPGWCGANAAGRPEQLKTQIERGNLLTWEQFETYFAGMVTRWNHEHVCGDRPAPPGQMYADAAPRKKWDPSTLAFLLQRRESARVTQNGVMVRGRWYWEADHLANYVGQTVELRYDPAMLDFVFAYADGRSMTLTPKLFGTGDNPTSEAVLLAKRGARLQRQHVAQLAAAVKGRCPLPKMDKTGTYRMVRDRKLAERAEQRALQAMLTDEQAAATVVATPAFPTCWWHPATIYYRMEIRESLSSVLRLDEHPDDPVPDDGTVLERTLVPLVQQSFRADHLVGIARDEALADLALALAEPAVKAQLAEAPAKVVEHLQGLRVLPLPTTGRPGELVRERRKAARAAELKDAEPGIFPRTSTDWNSLVRLIALGEAAALVPLFQEIGAADALADAPERDAALARLGARLRQADVRKHMRKLPASVKKAIKATGLTLGKVFDSPCGDAIRAAEQEIKKEVAHAA